MTSVMNALMLTAIWKLATPIVLSALSSAHPTLVRTPPTENATATWVSSNLGARVSAPGLASSYSITLLSTIRSASTRVDVVVYTAVRHSTWPMVSLNTLSEITQMSV